MWGEITPVTELNQVKKERDDLALALFKLVGEYPYSPPPDVFVGEARQTLDKHRHNLRFQTKESINARRRELLSRQARFHRVDL